MVVEQLFIKKAESAKNVLKDRICLQMWEMRYMLTMTVFCTNN